MPPSDQAWESGLRALVIITKADTAPRGKTVGPEATEVDVDVCHLGMGSEEPGTEDWLGEDVKNSVSDDLMVNGSNAGAIGNTPDAVMMSAELKVKVQN